ncbi:MAG TPA: hypothetical protein V6D05_09465, partial [Stenomitos sp.]
MARLNVQWVNEADFLSFPEIACQPGYYLDVLTGDIFRNGGHFTAANARILIRHGDDPALGRKPFLLITENLDLTLGDVKEAASKRFGVPLQDLGKLVHS